MLGQKQFGCTIFVLFILCGCVICDPASNDILALLQSNLTQDLLNYNKSTQSYLNPLTFFDAVSREAGLIYSSAYITSAACTKQRHQIWQGLWQLKLWALQFIDSTGKPGSGFLQGNTVFLGNYDQCVSIGGDDGVTGSMARLRFFVQLPPDLSNIKSTIGFQETGLPFITWYVCLPSGCDKNDASNLGTQFAAKTHTQLKESSVLQSKYPYDDLCFIIAVIIFCILGFLCFIGTTAEVYIKCNKKEKTEESSQKDEEDEEDQQFVPPRGSVQVLPRQEKKFINAYDIYSEMTNIEAEQNVDVVDSSSETNVSLQKKVKVFKNKNKLAEFFKNFILAFSIQSNLADLLKSKHTPGDITCLHGIRVITISWVILGHCYYQSPQIGNTVAFYEMTKWWSFQSIVNATFAVDTFFLLSGCLVSYLFLRTVQKSGKLKFQDIVLYYVHRILRLTPLYALVILFYTGITPYLESGPYATSVHDRDVNCRKTWWWNILYISNLMDNHDMCMVWSWYLSNDMQFYAVAPLALVPIAVGYLYPGLFVAFLMFACHIVAYGVIDDKYGAAIYRNTENFMKNLYLTPWTRVGPYAVGLFLGIILFKRQKKQKLNKILAAVGWTLALAGGLTLVFATHDNFNEGGLSLTKWGHGSVVAYETLKSPMWAICVGWVVFACCSNCGGFINSFLSWQAWIPLSRLTFGAYLLHLIVMIFFNNNAKILNYFSYFFVIERFLSTFILAFGLSLVFSLLIETPVRNLIRPSKKLKPEVPAKKDTSSIKEETKPQPEPTVQLPESAAQLPDTREVTRDSRLVSSLDNLDGPFHIKRIFLPNTAYLNKAYEQDNGNNFVMNAQYRRFSSRY